jgi:hypothetical protein
MLACWREDPGSWWFNAPRPELVLMRSWCCWYRKRRLSWMSRVQGLLNCNPIPYSLTWPDLQNCHSQMAILHSALLEIPTPTRKPEINNRHSEKHGKALSPSEHYNCAVLPRKHFAHSVSKIHVYAWLNFPVLWVVKEEGGCGGGDKKFSQKPPKDEITRKIHARIGYALLIKWILRKQGRL